MEKRYYVENDRRRGPLHAVMDRHDLTRVVALCPDDFKAELICHLLNESWDEARNIGPAHD